MIYQIKRHIAFLLALGRRYISTDFHNNVALSFLWYVILAAAQKNLSVTTRTWFTLLQNTGSPNEQLLAITSSNFCRDAALVR